MLRKLSLIALASVLVALAAGADRALGEEKMPWPVKVENHKPVKPGEHPRLLFRRSDLQALRAKAKTPEGQAIIKRLRYLLDGKNGETMTTVFSPAEKAYSKGKYRPLVYDKPGAYTMSHAMGYGLLYQLTGDKKYAEFGRQCFEKAFEGVRDRDDRYSWKDPGGPLRAGPTVGYYALGYDLCYDGWDEQTQKKITKAFMDYRETNRKIDLEYLVKGKRHMPSSNHWGMQIGGGALATLALMGDPGTDDKKMKELLEISKKTMIRNVTDGFGDGGWFAEGDGTGVMASHIIYLPAVQAWKVAGGLDFVTPRPNVPWTYMKFVLLSYPNGEKKPIFPNRGAYPHNIWANDGVSGPGTFCAGLGIASEAHKQALLWLHNRVKGYTGLMGTASPYPHHAVMALVNLPTDVKEANPAGCMPRYVHDSKFGFFAFRNRFKDDNDVLVSCQPQTTRGWHKANKEAGQLWVRHDGKRHKWAKMSGKVTHFAGAADGSGTVSVKSKGGETTCLAVDFSGAAGVDGMLVMTGPGAPNKTTVQAGDVTYSFLFIGEGKAPEPQVSGNKVVIGKQTVSMTDGRIVLEKMAGSWPG
ncbi:MAG: hypothetical protein ACLFVU_00685 [Phycisphaerae bacterium]